MRSIAVASQKGGVGKTTTVVNLAACLAERDRRVLVVDLDAQASASAWLGDREEERGSFDLLLHERALDAVVRPTDLEGVDLVPGSPWLVGIDRRLDAEAEAEGRLRLALRGLGTGPWDYLLVDCPPNLGLATLNALVAARELIVPIEPNVLALRGLVQLLRTVDSVRDRFNPELRLAGILQNRFDGRTRHAREVEGRLRERFGDRVLATVVRQTIRLAECPSFHRPITEYAPRCHAAKDFRALAREIIAQEGS